MSRINEIYKLYDAELALVRQQANLLLQKRSEGFSGELKSSGTIIERYIRNLITQHIPNGYRLCSGYITTAEKIDDHRNLIQHDAIIVDCRIPSIHKFGFGDIELIPAEAVCGIIEIKKTLTTETIKESIEHLSKINKIFETYEGGIRSKTLAVNNRASPSLSFATCAPFYGIIGLEADKDSLEKNKNELLSLTNEKIGSFIDMIWAPASPFLIRFMIQDNNGVVYSPLIVSRNQDGYTPTSMYDWFEDERKIDIYGKAISLLRTWINNSSGTILSLDKTEIYFGV